MRPRNTRVLALRAGAAALITLSLLCATATRGSAAGLVANWSSINRTTTTPAACGLNCWHTSAWAGPAATECEEAGSPVGILGCEANLEVTYSCTFSDPQNLNEDIGDLVGQGLLNFYQYAGDPAPVQIPVQVTPTKNVGEAEYAGAAVVTVNGVTAPVAVEGTFTPACLLTGPQTFIGQIG